MANDQERSDEEIRADLATAERLIAEGGDARDVLHMLAMDVEPLLIENERLRSEVQRHESFIRAIKDCRDDPASAIAWNDITNGRAIIAAELAEAEVRSLRGVVQAAREIEDELFMALLAAGQSAWPQLMPTLVAEARKLSIKLHGALAAAADAPQLQGGQDQ